MFPKFNMQDNASYDCLKILCLNFFLYLISIFIELIFCIVYEIKGFHCSGDSSCLLGNDTVIQACQHTQPTEL